MRTPPVIRTIASHVPRSRPGYCAKQNIKKHIERNAMTLPTDSNKYSTVNDNQKRTFLKYLLPFLQTPQTPVAAIVVWSTAVPDCCWRPIRDRPYDYLDVAAAAVVVHVVA